MSSQPFWRRFLVRGVFWRQFIRFANLHLPSWIEPVVVGFWCAFFLLWRPVRRGVMRNLKVIKPGSLTIANFFRCYRTFWNFAWTLCDTGLFRERGMIPDWEFTGYQHFQAMQAAGGAILLTAHMGSYDLGAHLFAEQSGHRIVMVRAPERDPETRAYEEKQQWSEARIEFNVKASDLAIDLLQTVRDGGIIAIQGDRVAGDIAHLKSTLFGKPASFPTGPFALAMAAQAPIYPVFIVRTGRRRYRVIAYPPITVPSTRDRQAAFSEALESWRVLLEEVIGKWWFSWFAFEEIA